MQAGVTTVSLINQEQGHRRIFYDQAGNRVLIYTSCSEQQPPHEGQSFRLSFLFFLRWRTIFLLVLWHSLCRSDSCVGLYHLRRGVLGARRTGRDSLEFVIEFDWKRTPTSPVHSEGARRTLKELSREVVGINQVLQTTRKVLNIKGI